MSTGPDKIVENKFGDVLFEIGDVSKADSFLTEGLYKQKGKKIQLVRLCQETDLDKSLLEKHKLVFLSQCPEKENKSIYITNASLPLFPPVKNKQLQGACMVVLINDKEKKSGL